MLLVAHSGHWLAYVLPVLIVAVAIAVASFRERRAGQAARGPREP